MSVREQELNGKEWYRMDKNLSEKVIQNLKDAGCDKDTILSFMDCMKKKKVSDQIRLLERHRYTLLDRVHAEEKKIDCLDYLIYQIENGKAV